MLTFLELYAKRLFVIVPWAAIFVALAELGQWPTWTRLLGGLAIAAVSVVLFPTPLPKEPADGRAPRRTNLD